MPGRRRPDDFSLFRKSQAPRFAGPGAEAKTGSGSAETRTAEGGRFRRPVCNAGLPSGRSDAEYILGRRSCFSPGRVQRRRPVRVLPRRERLRGAVSAAPCAMQVCLRGGPMRNISSEEEAVFRRAGCRGEDRFGFCRDGERPRGACRCRRSVCSAGLPSGRSDAEYILERRSCFSPGRAQSRGLSDRIEEREATARTSRFFVSVPAADAACGARPGRAASAAGGCGSRPRRAALRESADA